MRRFLDRLYAGALWLSAACLVVIALLVGLQLAGRILDGLLKMVGLQPVGFIILSLAEIAGYLLAAASFLALAATLKAGAHIRVTMLLSVVGERWRYFIELWAFAAAAGFSTYMTWNLARFAFVSWQYNEVSFGLIPVPLVYPQAAMAAGAIILTIALFDETLIVFRRGRPSFRGSEEAISVGKES